MSSKYSIRSKPSTTGKVKKTVDIYEDFRPRSGIRYELDQTETNLIAGNTKMKMQHTTVEYEPGQDLNLPTALKKIRYARQRNRGPVWRFNEEIECQRRSMVARGLQDAMADKIKQRKIKDKVITGAMHDELMAIIGPKWFHELAPSQMMNADTLHIALKQDVKYKIIKNTMDKLIGIGLVLLPHNTKVQHCVKHYHNCPTEFLLKLYQLTRDTENKNKYSLNDRILLSCITHLSLRQTLRELHLRIPSPPREKIVRKRRVLNFQLELKKQSRMKFKSPYLKPTIFIPQLHKHEVYKNRHKEYASSEYFDYVDDMYNLTYEEVKKCEATKKSKYRKLPKIPVRQLQSKIEKRKVYNLKKPSPYISPCSIAFDTEPEPEPEPVETDICNCTPSSFNKDTTFELNIKITTSNEVMTFTQKLCPYSPDCTVDELQLKEHTVLDSEKKCGDDCDNPGFKQIEYTCVCSKCNKTVNIISDNLKKFSIPNNQVQNTDANEQKTKVYTDPIDASKVCKCSSVESKDPCEDLGDICDCTSLTEECTCCICAENQDFVLKLKRYNEANNTNIKPCLCACKCKKHRRKPCCLTLLEKEQGKCKYCFCNRIKRRPDVPMPENEEILIKKETEEAPEGSEQEKRISISANKMENKRLSKMIEAKRLSKVKPSIDSKSILLNKLSEKTGNKNQLTVKHSQFFEFVESDNSLCDECKCDTMFDQYMYSHDSCMELFERYETKIKEDLRDYLKDLEERCICGDSISDLEQEEISLESSSCSCLQVVNKPIHKSSSFDINRCTCSESTGSVSLNKCECPPKRNLMGTPTCPYGRAQLEQLAQENAPEDLTTSTQLTADLKTGSPKKNTNKSTTPSTLVKSASDTDSRIFTLEKLPTKRKDQMELLQKVLNCLAEDGYPLAQFPEVHKLPIFKLWFDKRNNKYVSMDQRAYYTEETRKYTAHIETCKRPIPLPRIKWRTRRQLASLTWARIHEYQKYLRDLKEDFQRKFKHGFISKGQEFFPPCFMYKLPTKNFRDCFFAYMPADENHAFVFRPWQVHEIKRMTK